MGEGTPLKLNLGSGQNKFAGYINVDKFPEGGPDVLWDLEQFPWPWETSSVDEVVLSHVLEHLGQTSDLYFGVMKELYRVCKPNAKVIINVPHPRHDYYLSDPTHVRPITPEHMEMFSKTINRKWADRNLANTPLGLYLDVDFEIVSRTLKLDEPWHSQYTSKAITLEVVMEAVRLYNNVAKQIDMELRVLKDDSPLS